MKSRIIITLCILSGILFIVSGLSKLFPTELFELTLVKIHLVNWTYAPYLARVIIAFELFLGVSLLQKHYIKLVIASAMVLLAIFSLHLAYIIYTTGNIGNCGCFGELIPMSPLGALIKNIVLFVILDYAYIEYRNEDRGIIFIPVIILVVSFIAVFVISPVQGIQKDKVSIHEMINDFIQSDTTSISAPTINASHSSFGEFHNFSDSKDVNLDSGIKITALLSLDCDHCMAAAKEIVALSRKMKLPPVYFLYLGVPEQLKSFYAGSGANNIPYKIINARTFFSLLKDSPPRIVLLKNGNIIGDWGSKDFSAMVLKKKLAEK